MREGGGSTQNFLGFDRIDENNSGVTAVGGGGRHPAGALLKLHITDGLFLQRCGFTGELLLSPDLDACLAESVPGPIAFHFKRQHAQPVIQQLALRCESEGRVVGRQGVANSAAATELGAFTWLANQAQALKVEVQLRGEPLHERALSQLFALHGEGHKSQRIVELRRIGLQVDTQQLLRLKFLAEELLLLDRILPHEELHRLAREYELPGQQGFREPKVFRLVRFV